MAERKTTRVGELLPILAAAATLALMLLWLVHWLIVPVKTPHAPSAHAHPAAISQQEHP